MWVFSAIGKSNKNDIKTTDLLINYTKSHKDRTKIKHQIIEKFSNLCNNTHVQINIPKIIDFFCDEYEKNCDSDWFISRGEYLTTQIMAKYLGIKFVPAENVIYLKNGKLNIEKTEKAIKKLILTYKNIAIPGFYAQNNIINNDKINAKIKLFSRGGSDFSACVLAKCLGAAVCENWTDVDGVYPINPNLEKSTILKKLSYNDLSIMTKMDANIIHKNCAKLLNGSDTILQVRNIFNLDNEGTIISSSTEQNINFLSYKKGKNGCKLFKKLKNGGSITLNLANSEFLKGVKFLKKIKNQL